MPRPASRTRLLRAATGAAAILALAAAPPAPAELDPASGDPRADFARPELTLRARARQALATGRPLRLYARTDEPCELIAFAHVRGAAPIRRLRVVTPAKAAPGGRPVRLEVRPSPRAMRGIGDALDAHRKVTVEVIVIAIDLAENETQRVKRIEVVRQRRRP